MPSHGPLIPLAKRHAILTLSWFTEKTWPEISTCLCVIPTTARLICERAKSRATDPTNFDEVLACIEDPKPTSTRRPGPPEKIPEGSAESQALGQLALQDEEHYRKPFPDIAKELGIVAARSTIENVMHNHHGIFRYRGRKKPGLDEEHKNTWVNFADMALHIRIQAIVFTDEMWVEFNSVRREGNVSRPKSADPYNYAIHHDFNPTTIRVMFWGCIAYGYKGPCHIWEKDSDEDKKRYNEIVEEENRKHQRLHEDQVIRAYIPNTEEWRIVQKINTNIDHINVQEGRTGRHKRRHKKPEHIDEFKHRQMTWQSKGEINWVSYQERVLKPHLYPFIDYLQQETGEPVVYLVEDNAPAHLGAQEVDSEAHREKGIITFNWPSKAPDINKIEPIWDYEKDEIATYQFTGASQSTVEEAKATLRKVWDELPQEYIDRMCFDFHDKLKLVIRHHGDNNFNG